LLHKLGVYNLSKTKFIDYYPIIKIKRKSIPNSPINTLLTVAFDTRNINKIFREKSVKIAYSKYNANPQCLYQKTEILFNLLMKYNAAQCIIFNFMRSPAQIKPLSCQVIEPL